MATGVGKGRTGLYAGYLRDATYFTLGYEFHVEINLLSLPFLQSQTSASSLSFVRNSVLTFWEGVLAGDWCNSDTLRLR